MLLALAAATAGCLRSTSYPCDRDTQCVAAVQGTCEPVGYCSFPDDDCASGRRFADGAAAQAGQCVGGGDDVDAAAIDARTDAAIDASIDAPSLPCDDPGNGSTFPNGGPCEGWGTPFSTGVTVQNMGGRLVLTATANLAGISGGCSHPAVPFAAPGVLAEVDRVLVGTTSRTRLELEGTGLWIGVVGGMIEARAGALTLASVPYNETTMRWWRLRPVAGAVWYETAPDGHAWTRLAMSSPAPASAPLRLVAETNAAEPTPGFARFDSINVCP